MSSEESQWGEDNNGCASKYYKKKPIPLWADKVNTFFERLDEKSTRASSLCSKYMTVPRSVGSPSDRLKPPYHTESAWKFKRLVKRSLEAI